RAAGSTDPARTAALTRRLAPLFDLVQRNAVARDEVPVVLHAQPRPLRHAHLAFTVHAIELVVIAALIHRRHGVRAVRSHQRDLVVVAVAHRGHAVAVRGTAGVNLGV